ncbi:MAG TPA: hypothetical protein VJG13_04895, partial [Thermoanaerobaculia bacterium]|nr:hypothetical protein [Thermoanaerobaculia bacterium]
MPDLAKTARRLYRRLAGARPEAVHPGTPSAADGAAAVARAEELAGAVFAAGATGRSRLASAMGLAAAGERAAVLLTGAELTEAVDLLATAADRRLPLVVHWVAGAGGHAPLHAATATGALVLVAADVQEAADLAWIARRAAEEALLPAVVAEDGAETWASVQDVLLPDAASAARILGGPGDPIHAPTRAQELLFGRHRRRAVRWHDPARPMASGTLFGAPSGTGAATLAAAGRRAYLDGEAAAALERAFEAFGGETGRRYQALTGLRIERAGLVLVAAGATAGTAAAVAERQGENCPRVGVVALRCLRPFPEARLAELLRWSPAVAVVERQDAPLAEDGPLAAAVRAALWRREDRRQPGAGRSGGDRGRDARWPYGSGLAAEVSAALGGQSAAAGGGVSAALPGADAAAAGG